MADVTPSTSGLRFLPTSWDPRTPSDQAECGGGLAIVAARRRMLRLDVIDSAVWWGPAGVSLRRCGVMLVLFYSTGFLVGALLLLFAAVDTAGAHGRGGGSRIMGWQRQWASFPSAVLVESSSPWQVRDNQQRERQQGAVDTWASQPTKTQRFTSGISSTTSSAHAMAQQCAGKTQQATTQRKHHTPPPPAKVNDGHVEARTPIGEPSSHTPWQAVAPAHARCPVTACP